MTRDHSDIVQLTFFAGISSAFEAWVNEKRLFSTAMLPLICTCLVLVASCFCGVKPFCFVSLLLMLATGGLVVESSSGAVEQRAPIYLSFFASGSLILAFALLHGGDRMIVDAPLAVVLVATFFLSGGSALVGLVRLLDHV